MPRSTEPKRTHRTLERLKRKTARVTLLLEHHLGIPARRTASTDPLDMLIATILSQNTNDRNSHRAYTELRRRYPTWDRVASAPPAALRSALRTGGMANLKSRHIRETLGTIKARYGRYDLGALRKKSSETIIEELTGLNGVGVKTAACVLLFALRRDVFPVDTHVHRICSRLGLAPGSRNPERTFEAMKELIPPGKAHSLHTNMIRFGRTVCRPLSPRCEMCPLYAHCTFDGKSASARPGRGVPSVGRDFMLLDNV